MQRGHAQHGTVAKCRRGHEHRAVTEPAREAGGEQRAQERARSRRRERQPDGGARQVQVPVPGRAGNWSSWPRRRTGRRPRPGQRSAATDRRRRSGGPRAPAARPGEGSAAAPGQIRGGSGGSTGMTARRTAHWTRPRPARATGSPAGRRARRRRPEPRTGCPPVRCCRAQAGGVAPGARQTPGSPRRRTRTGIRWRRRPRAAPAGPARRGGLPGHMRSAPGRGQDQPASSPCGSATGPPTRRRRARTAGSAPVPPRARRPAGRRRR